MQSRPKLLFLATLAETGGAQTFVRALAEGLHHEYRIEIAAHGPAGALAEASAELGIPFHHVTHLVRKVDPRNDALAVLEIRRLVRRVRPDLVQMNSTKAGLVGRIALAGTGVPVVFTAHGWAFSGRRGLAGSCALAAERAMAPLSTALVCVSDWDRSLALSQRLAPAPQVRAIHNGIRVPERPTERGPWPKVPLLVCVARLAPPKEIDVLLEALAQEGLSNWRLNIIGDGPDRDRLLALIGRLGLGSRVQMLGERSDVPEQLATADALVLPSKWEGLPYSVLEAMAAGLPVVASSVGGVPELVVDRETGRLVPPGSAQDLAVALRELDAAGDGARRLGRAGHERVRRHFSVDAMVGSYNALFTSLLSAPAATSRWSRHAVQ